MSDARTPETDAPTSFWRTPWPWVFVVGALVLPWFRPWLSRIPEPPPSLGAWTDAGQGGVTLAVVCPEGTCTSADGVAGRKLAGLLSQMGVAPVRWQLVVAASDKFMFGWSGSAGAVPGAEGEDTAANEAAESALRAQQAIRHPLAHAASDPWGAVLVIDGAGVVRGVMDAATAEGRREIVYRVEGLLRAQGAVRQTRLGGSTLGLAQLIEMDGENGGAGACFGRDESCCPPPSLVLESRPRRSAAWAPTRSSGTNGTGC